jgi:hypothetical protein
MTPAVWRCWRRSPPRLVAAALGRQAVRRGDYVGNRGESGSARLALETTLMTLSRQGRPKFAVMHKTAFVNDVLGCSPRRQETPSHETARVYHYSRRRGAWASMALAQEPRRVIGVLGSASSGAFPGAEAAFIQGLKNTAFIVDRMMARKLGALTACRIKFKSEVETTG